MWGRPYRKKRKKDSAKMFYQSWCFSWTLETVKDKWELMTTDSDCLHAIAPQLCMALQRDVNGHKKKTRKKISRSLPAEPAV